jgi:DNA-binding NarL/FixJ family response regulator
VTAGEELEVAGRQLHAGGDYAGALDTFERAYEAYRREGDLLAAARAARTVGWFRGWVLGDWAVHQGWLRRARTLLEQAGAGAQGWLLLEDARAGSDLESQRRLYLQVIDLARATGDCDLECEATASLGIMLVFSGLVPEGMAYLDDALAAICGGDVDELSVVEGCLCGLLNACERTHDVIRAQQWLRAAAGVFERRRLTAVAGYCRAHYASILISGGRWVEAEEELAAALQILPSPSAVRDSAVCRLAGLRVRQGRFEEAEELLGGLDHHEEAVHPLAALHIGRGRPQLAVELLERALAAPGLPDYVEVPLLAQVVDAHVAVGASAAARASSARLTEVACDQPAPYLKALAALARARTGDGDPRSRLHEAMSLFAEANTPVELAQCRLALARVLAGDRPTVAIAEAEAARKALEQLGASRDAAAAAALLRSLGAPAPAGPRQTGPLTKRESEVLTLLEQGLTNAEIGERLFISGKTVEHHVGRILTKLGLRSRTEAAARAAREKSGRV